MEGLFFEQSWLGSIDPEQVLKFLEAWAAPFRACGVCWIGAVRD
jgi:hypothetical protein